MNDIQLNNLLEHPIIYIGGASTTGKTTVTQTLCKSIRRDAIGLDKYSNLINTISQDESITSSAKADLAQLIVEDLLFAGANCIVEGVWIKPDLANKIRDKFEGKFTAIYCGYPNIDPKDHLKTIIESGDHWLAHKPQYWALNFIANEVKSSKKFKEECQLYCFPFMDFSDLKKGSKQLLSLFQSKPKSINPPIQSLSFTYKF